MKNRNVKELTRADRVMATKKEPLGANILRSDVLVVTDYALLYRNAGIRMGQPYRAKEPRIMLVTSGKAKIEVNGIGFQLLPNSVILVPANGTVEIQTMDADFNGCALVFPISMYKEEYGRMLFHPQHLDVSDSEAGLLKDYFRLLHSLFSLQREDEDLTELMVTFALKCLVRLYGNSFSGIRLPSRSQEIFNEFVEMVNRKILKERRVTYYAEELGITTSHLNQVVQKFGFRTTKEWLELAVCREAKMLLNGSKDNLEKIAVALGFCNATQFGTFFKKHTGQTPMEYRNGKEIPVGEAEEKNN